MSILLNFSVYGLMVLPLAAMVNGHHVSLLRLIKLVLLCFVVQMAQSIVVAAAPADGMVSNVVVYGVLLPLIQVSFCNFILTDAKALKALHLLDSDDGDAAAAVATVWCAVYTVVYRCFAWYHTMSSRSFDAANIISAADAYFSLIATLLLCRSLRGAGQGAKDRWSSSSNPNDSRRGASVVGIVLLYTAAAAVAAMCPAVPFLRSAAAAALLGLRVTVMGRQSSTEGEKKSK